MPAEPLDEAGRLPLARRHPLLAKLAGGIFTQSMLSATNLLISVWIARVNDKAEFGLYNLAVNTLAIFLNLQNGLVNSPLTVILPDQKGEDRDILLAGLGLGQWLVAVPATLLLVIGALVFGLADDGLGRVRWVFPLLLAAPAQWLREFVRVLHYNELRVLRVIRMDAAYILATLAGMLALHLAGLLDSTRVLLVIGIACLASGALGLRSTGLAALRASRAWIRLAFRRTWPYSRWALVGITATSVQANAHVYLTSALLGLAGTADIAAARTLLVPFALLISSSQRIFLAGGANLNSQHDARRMRRFLLLFLLFFTAAWAVYALALTVLYRPLILVLFTEKYLNIAAYLPFWALLFLINAWRFIVTYALQVSREFKNLALNGIVSAAAVILSAPLLIRAAGAAGMILALVIGEALLLVLSLPRLAACFWKKEGA